MKLLDHIASHPPHRVAYLHAASRATCTYGELHDRVRTRSAALSGRPIVLHAANHIEVPIWFLAAIASGVDVLLLSEAAADAEVAALARRIGAQAVVSDTIVADIGCPVWRLDSPASGTATRRETLGNMLLATSGSTGTPKIVRRSAASLDAVAQGMVEAIGFQPDDRVLAAVPLTHSYGIEHGLLAPLWAGSTIVLCAGLDLPSLTAAFGRGVTIFPAVPSMIERLADVGADVSGLHDVRVVYSAGGPLPQATRDRFTTRYGCAVGQLFGSTEVGTVLYRAAPASEGDVGWPMRGVSIRIVDVDDPQRPVAPGEIGEVAIRSPSMFDGYIAETAFDPATGSAADGVPDRIDGHFRTGDLGRLTPEGSLVLAGRSRLLIDTGGLKVNPLEVEQVLLQHPAIAACVVVPVRQSETVHRLRAVIVPRESGVITDQAVRAFARERLASYKVPRAIEFRTELPRSATGKVLRHIVEAS